MLYSESYCIISDSRKTETKINVNSIKAVIIVNLFYEEQTALYRTYLDRISSQIDIVIISSKDTVLNMFQDKRYQTIKKKIAEGI